MPKKVEAAARENYWQKRKLYRVLKAENVSSQINFVIYIYINIYIYIYIYIYIIDMYYKKILHYKTLNQI